MSKPVQRLEDKVLRQGYTFRLRWRITGSQGEWLNRNLKEVANIRYAKDLDCTCFFKDADDITSYPLFVIMEEL